MQTVVQRPSSFTIPRPMPLLSEAVIPAVRGEFYSYSTQFTVERPLVYLMKCKANKDRDLFFARQHPAGLDLVFLLGDTVSICTPRSTPAVRLLEGFVGRDLLGHTRIARADISLDLFDELRHRKNGSELARACRMVTTGDVSVLELAPGMIISVITNSGKFGLLRVSELTPTSVLIDAYHILL